ncbi:MAG: hypothetical protein EA424_08840 [Planctomycetaceae bacterium]|nr:MAG: hypothetical protein EA424_08840 [Planctomycetaceae bacterium]
MIRLEFGHQQGEVGLFCRFPTGLRRFILEPLAAKYPDCRFAEVSDADGSEVSMPLWYADLRLVPDVYPILRHAQLEDMLTGKYEAPIDASLKAVQPGGGDCVPSDDGHSSGVAPSGVLRLDGRYEISI